MSRGLLTLRGVYMDGKIILLDDVAITGRHEVLVTFLSGGEHLHAEDSSDVMPGHSPAADEVSTEAALWVDCVVVARERHIELLRAEAGLTSHETDILELVARGMTNQDVGNALELSPGTVRNALSKVYAKLGVHNRAEAVWKARELGILT